MADFKIGSIVMFVKNNFAIKGVVVGYHNNLGMFKIKDEAGKDHLIELEDLVLCEQEVEEETIQDISVGSVVEILPKHLKDNFGLGLGHYVSINLNWSRLFGVVIELTYKEGREVAYVINITENKLPDTYKDTYQAEFVYLDNLSVCFEEITQTEDKQEDSSVIEEGDFVVIKASNINSNCEVAESLLGFVENEELVGTVCLVDYSDDTALVSYLYNQKTLQKFGGDFVKQWVKLEDLEKTNKNFEETDNLITLINKWGTDRNITLEGGTTPQKQVSKLVEEVAECIEALDDITLEVDGAEDKLKDAYGDMLVCIIQAIRLSGMDFNDCLNVAYNEIKGRKGTMVNGKFVKES